MNMPDNSQFTEAQRAEAFRVESMTQMMRQTRAIESIRLYVAIWFWLMVAGTLLVLVLSEVNGGL